MSRTPFSYSDRERLVNELRSSSVLADVPLPREDQLKISGPFPSEARINNKNVPEGAVAYTEADVFRRFERQGFSDLFVSHGRWSGPRARGFHQHHQDIVIARKPD